MVFKAKIDAETRICTFFGEIQGHIYEKDIG